MNQTIISQIFPDAKSMIVIGESLLRKYVDELIGRSAWFDIMPLPDDEYYVTVKSDNADIFEKDFS